ncbi:fibro-slime domain-containing protein [Intestinibacter bartlettii]|uniref:fibro-slime domain-containing protein n=1 Tax=Intestinibacter bartlettii TaxID=261299 RepID=UPI0006C538F7|nr:fibro-slime domain-containing protein [Intestinibacter bartlettii]CUO51497.1 fibro-slime domain [Intestinibacter bartlettii]
MKKFVNKFLAVAVSFVTAIAMVPLSSGGMAYAETSPVTNNVKYFSTTMYNYEKNAFNGAAGKTDKTNNFYFINENSDWTWAQSGTINWCYNTNQGYNKKAYNVLVQGIVKNELDSKGQIQFNYNNAGVFTTGGTKVNGKDVYQNVQFPFVHGNDGYYEFDSTKNHVHVDKNGGDNQKLTLDSGAQSAGGQGTFFPFNSDGDSKADYHFGMNMSVPFYMNENGTDSSGKAIRFEFSGDDDVWVFINGKLVLDLGGIHDIMNGSIDFSTGKVEYTYTGKNSNIPYAKQVNSDKSLTQQKEAQNTTLEKLGITKADLAKGENNLQIFYLERGAGSSNCKIRFNLPQRDTLQVSKTLEANTPYTENGFEFQLLKKDGNDYKPVSSKGYALYNDSSLISNTEKTDGNGKFTLQAGQHANFTGVSRENSEYKVVELTDGYETTWSGTNGKKVDGENAYALTIKQNLSDEVSTYNVNCVNKASVVLNDDTIVLDYGKPVEYDVTANDTNAPSGSSVYGIGKGNLPKNSSDATGYTGLNTDVALDNGNIKINENGVVTYTPTRYMNSVDKANYAVKYQVKESTSKPWEQGNMIDKYAYATVNVLPATSVYYEDDFGTDGNGDPNVAIVWTGTWKDSKKDEDQSQTGISSKDNQQSSDNKNYGWDDSYKDDIKYSNGSAHYSSEKLASATFRFKGTGVDVYSRTNDGVGKIIATLKKVTKNEDGTESLKTIKNVGIDNLSVSGDYYQIPTLNFDGLDYATYEVTIKVVPVLNSDKTVKRATYYLDGIRVYNPLGKVDANSTAGKAYEEANESNAQYIQVRKDLLDSSKVQAIDTAIKGSLFIDKSEDTVGDRSDSIGTYKEYGPKNEVYLKKDQGVAFTINNYNSNKNKVFIGLKSPTGKNVTVKITTGSKYTTKTISSAADLYYELTPTSDGKVVIENTTDNLLSITKVRITTKNSINGLTADYSLTSTPELMSYVNSFDTLQEEQDTIQKDTEDTLDKGDVDIDNPSDNNTNTDNDKQDNNNQQNQSNNIWNKIISSIKGWFRR